MLARRRICSLQGKRGRLRIKQNRLRGDPGLNFARRVRPRIVEQGVQHDRVKLLADDDAAMRKTQMQKACAALCMMDFQRMLQYQDFRGMRDRQSEVADTCSLRPQTSSAQGTFGIGVRSAHRL